MEQEQQNSPSQVAGFTGFPTRHPMDGNSNVLLAGVNLDNREYVIPTMVGGEKLSMNDAIRVARNHGLDRYPSFNSVAEASQWAETNHGNISADGKLNPTTQNNTNIMAQNTFLQDLMSNAPQKTWQQPPELSPAAQLYTPGAAPTPTQAPPAMAAPAANQAPLTMAEMTERDDYYNYNRPSGFIKPEYRSSDDGFGLHPIAAAILSGGGKDAQKRAAKAQELLVPPVPSVFEGPAAPTPRQMRELRRQNTQAPSTNAAPTPTPALRPMTPEYAAEREAARGGPGIPAPVASLPNGYSPFGGISAGGPTSAELAANLPEAPAFLTPAWKQAKQADLQPSASAPAQTQVASSMTTPEPAPTPEPAIKPQTAVQLDPMSDEAILARRAQRQGTSSPQQNFQLRVSNGEPLSQEEIAQAESLAKHMGTTFDPVTGYSRQPFLDAQSTPQPEIQQPQGLTTISGAPLNEFLSGAAMPEQGFARAENAMYGDNSLSRGLGGDAATKAFQDASEARDGRLGFSNRPGVDAPSLAMQRSRMDAGLDPVEGAPTGTDMSQQQQRDALERGFDPATGQPIKGTGSAKEDAEIGKIRAETAEILSKIGEKGTELNLSPAELARDKAAGATLNKWDDSGRATIKSNITSLNEVIGGLESGQIKTRGFIDALPFGADWARAIMNPTGQDAKDRVQGVIFQTLRETLGAQFTQKEGERLVEASYNVKLSPEQNATRLRDYTTGLKRAAEARESQMRYLKENKTLSGYEGPTPSSVMSQVGAGGEGGSPIQGDIDYQSDIQSAASEIMNSK